MSGRSSDSTSLPEPSGPIDERFVYRLTAEGKKALDCRRSSEAAVIWRSGRVSVPATAGRQHRRRAREGARGYDLRSKLGRMPALARTREVESQRLFSCARCRRKVVICSRCDRGQAFCGRTCAQAARRENQRASNRRYQATPRGRQLHAARQARYRNRLRQRPPDARVTEQGSLRPIPASLKPGRRPSTWCCPVCGATQTPFLRLDTKTRRNRASHRPSANPPRSHVRRSAG
jgi:hypothetical protein